MNTLIKSILQFLGIFSILFVVLTAMSFTTPVKKAINNFYGKTHLGIYETLMPKLGISFHSGEKTKDWNNFYFQVYNKKEAERLIEEAKRKGLRSVKQSSLDINFYLNVFFTPFLIFLIALILATPLPLKNRFAALLVGLILFFLYQIFRVYIKMLDNVQSELPEVYGFEGISKSLLDFAAGTLQAGFTAGIVAFIWAVVVFNKKNVVILREKLE